MAVTTSTVAAPTYLQPAVQSGAQYLQDLAMRPYTPYTAPRVASASPLEKQAFNAAANYQLSPELGIASSAFQSGIGGLMQGMNYNPQQFSRDAANYYMDPYIEEVLNIQRREADTNFQKQQSQNRLRAASAGAFGGSRATLLETETQRGQNQLMDDILAKGLSSAYSQAREQFNADQNQRLAAAKFGQEGMQSVLQGAQGIGNLGTNIENAERARLAQMADFGLQQRQQQQANLDAQYQQFLDERDYPLKIADTLTGGISRLQGNTRTETVNTPNLSNFEQLLGGATSIAGLLGTLGGQGGAGAGVDFLKGLLPDNILGDVGGFLDDIWPF